MGLCGVVAWGDGMSRGGADGSGGGVLWRVSPPIRGGSEICWGATVIVNYVVQVLFHDSMRIRWFVYHLIMLVDN